MPAVWDFAEDGLQVVSPVSFGRRVRGSFTSSSAFSGADERGDRSGGAGAAGSASGVGRPELRARLVALGRRAVPAASTITAILHRHGRIEQEESLKRVPVQRFEREAPRAVADGFQGRFRYGRRSSLPSADDHRRPFALFAGAAGMFESAIGDGSESLSVVFRRYGLPWSMLTDNGAPGRSRIVSDVTRSCRSGCCDTTFV